MALSDLQLTSEGWELQFATNPLGHFALACGLHDALAAVDGARIVSLWRASPVPGHLRRWGRDGIIANAVHPGAIADSNLSRHMNPDELAAVRRSGMFTYKTLGQGAATSVLVATSPQLEGVGGCYFEDCNQAVVLHPDAPETSGSGVAAYALEPDAATRLWNVSIGGPAMRTTAGEHNVEGVTPCT